MLTPTSDLQLLISERWPLTFPQAIYLRCSGNACAEGAITPIGESSSIAYSADVNSLPLELTSLDEASVRVRVRVRTPIHRHTSFHPPPFHRTLTPSPLTHPLHHSSLPSYPLPSPLVDESIVHACMPCVDTCTCMHLCVGGSRTRRWQSGWCMAPRHRGLHPHPPPPTYE